MTSFQKRYCALG